MEFKKYKLKQIGTIVTGCTPATKERDFYSSSDFLFVGPSDIKTSKYIYETDKNISFEAYMKYKTRFIPKNSIMVDCIGSDMGNVAIASKECLTNQQINSICNIDNDNFNFEYIYYVLSTMKNHFHTIGFNGSTMPIINKSLFENIEIKLPPKKVQDRIVNVLSHIDKKIELNNRINDSLERISRELYKKWFIDFDFPNENGKPYKSSGGEMIESELGGIPKGWKISNFDDDILTKIIKSGVDSYPGEKRYVATADVNGTKINNFSKLKYNEKPSRANMPPIKNSVWFAKMKGSVKNILVEEFMEEIIDNYIFSTGFLGMECLNKSTSYIWSIINDDKFISDKDNLSTGTLMAGINNETIKKYKYLIPVVRVLEKYNETIENINREIYSLNSENSQLTNLRDTLLPKLLNGEIDLEQIEV